MRTLPELMRIAIQHLPSASAKTPRKWSQAAFRRGRGGAVKGPGRDTCKTPTGVICVSPTGLVPPIKTPNERNRALHTNYAGFLLDAGNRGVRNLMQCSERNHVWLI